jgi:hypothetical protein
MRKVLMTILAMTISVNAWMQTIKPIERTIGKLHVSVDPRMELLSTIQILSDYKVIDRNSPYSKEIQAYFNSVSSHRAVELTDELFQNHGFSFDAPVTFMLHLSQVPELKQQIQFSDYLSRRAGNKENLDNYRTSIEQFARESNFEMFWVNKNEFYKKVIDLTISDLADIDLIKALEDYFNESQNSYSIIISPSFRGGYGPRLPASNNKYDIYSCNSTTDNRDGIPYLSKDNLIYYVWHEFGHSFVNPQTDKYYDKVLGYDKLFSPIREDMAKLNYSDLSTLVNELVIRAINVRLRELYISPVASRKLLNRELENGFVYIQPVIEKLKEYEKQRDSRHITFSGFYPQLINLFDSLQNSDNSKLTERKFSGPINTAIAKQKLAFIYPTCDNDTVSLKIVQGYVANIFKKLNAEGSILVSDSVALHTRLSDFGIMAYGTIESNLFLKHYKSSFPFKIENNIIYADHEYNDVNTMFISCLPNPLNSQKGMVIYTAISNKSIQDINNVFHGGEDYILFFNRDKIISRGYYDKIDGWKYFK